MLTRITIRNFKRFRDVEVELGNPVVFIGPNNSGKTSAMQALALWDIGLKRWNEKRRGQAAPERRPGVTVNRRDLLAIPHPSAAMLWRDLHTRRVQRIDGRQRTDNVRIELVVEGVHDREAWRCGLEFDYANSESFYCRPLRLDDAGQSRMAIPDDAGRSAVAFLPPMSGLAATETRLYDGAIDVRIGEGRTADVLRNLCLGVSERQPDKWDLIVRRIKDLFGAELGAPEFVQERGEIVMRYRERNVTLDLSSSGRGLQQTLLILTYLYANPDAVILLDEPDAHLEILRQAQIYRLLAEVAAENGSQIVAGSHSEVLLNEAAETDLVISFVGPPHRLDGGTSQVRKALVEIGFDQYHLAEQTGWVLYLEGSTDLSMLQALARRLGKDEIARVLERPFVHFASDQPNEARRHFYGLREAVPHLKGVALFDRIDRNVAGDGALAILCWERREIENYICTQQALEACARESARLAVPEPLLAQGEIERRVTAMGEAIAEVSSAMQTLGRGSPWSVDTKVSDDFLTPLFKAWFDRLGLPNVMHKRSFHVLADHVPESEIDPEVTRKLDAIAEVAMAALPGEDWRGGRLATDVLSR